MRIHSDILQFADFGQILRDCGLAGEGVAIDVLEPKGSRSRARAFELHLAAHPGTDRFGKRRRWANTGHSGAASHVYLKAATYDEWGVFLAALFECDPDMACLYYKTHADFLRKTEGDRFRQVTA